jgi:D-tagatose-1,6-bisphosphate aldolase subunit GatZ/KbaZ
MTLSNDQGEVINPELIAQRSAFLAQAAEIMNQQSRENQLLYIIGTEVPVPGGLMNEDEGLHITRPEDVHTTIESHRQAFLKIGLDDAWSRVIAVVVQPGVEFGDDFISEYNPEKAQELSSFIEDQRLQYEAHSTDYQPKSALRNLVTDHFSILKVGPNLTYAYREAVFSLAMMETELFPFDEVSNIIAIMDEVMVQYPEYWSGYYHGTPEEKAFKRKFSLSDRIRYYWSQPKVECAFRKLMMNLSNQELPLTLMSQYAPSELNILQEKDLPFTPDNIISTKITHVLDRYWQACE